MRPQPPTKVCPMGGLIGHPLSPKWAKGRTLRPSPKSNRLAEFSGRLEGPRQMWRWKKDLRFDDTRDEAWEAYAPDISSRIEAAFQVRLINQSVSLV